MPTCMPYAYHMLGGLLPPLPIQEELAQAAPLRRPCTPRSRRFSRAAGWRWLGGPTAGCPRTPGSGTRRRRRSSRRRARAALWGSTPRGARATRRRAAAATAAPSAARAHDQTCLAACRVSKLCEGMLYSMCWLPYPGRSALAKHPPRCTRHGLLRGCRHSRPQRCPGVRSDALGYLPILRCQEFGTNTFYVKAGARELVALPCTGRCAAATRPLVRTCALTESRSTSRSIEATRLFDVWTGLSVSSFVLPALLLWPYHAHAELPALPQRPKGCSLRIQRHTTKSTQGCEAYTQVCQGPRTELQLPGTEAALRSAFNTASFVVT